MAKNVAQNTRFARLERFNFICADDLKTENFNFINTGGFKTEKQKKEGLPYLKLNQISLNKSQLRVNLPNIAPSSH